MKYLKKYEEVSQKEPQIGDYIICKEDFINDEKLTSFLLSNIGQIYSIDPRGNYVVEYNNIPKDLETNFREYIREYNKNNLTTIYPSEIIEFSKNKEDLEIYINKMKYNL